MNYYKTYLYRFVFLNIKGDLRVCIYYIYILYHFIILLPQIGCTDAIFQLKNENRITTCYRISQYEK